MNEVESCARCHNCAEIEWADKRNALQCTAPGKYQGRVTQVFTKGKRSILEDMEKPAWCTSFARAGE